MPIDSFCMFAAVRENCVMAFACPALFKIRLFRYKHEHKGILQNISYSNAITSPPNNQCTAEALFLDVSTVCHDPQKVV